MTPAIARQLSSAAQKNARERVKQFLPKLIEATDEEIERQAKMGYSSYGIELWRASASLTSIESRYMLSKMVAHYKEKGYRVVGYGQTATIYWRDEE
jgi:hypothetical protein